MAESDAVVTLENVTVAYGRNQALSDVTTTFVSGAVGLLGPNGAGKSTMIKALLGFIVPSQGRMRVLGLDVATSPVDIRARIGYMPENDAHRRDAAGARGAFLRRPWRGTLSKRRDVLDRHETADQARPGPCARSGSAVSRRAHQRHGSQGPR